MVQGVYYYFYKIFRNKADAAALELKKTISELETKGRIVWSK